jgi:hypothetical protein
MSLQDRKKHPSLHNIRIGDTSAVKDCKKGAACEYLKKIPLNEAYAGVSNPIFDTFYKNRVNRWEHSCPIQ